MNTEGRWPFSFCQLLLEDITRCSSKSVLQIHSFVFLLCSTEDGTQCFMHNRQVLHQWAKSLSPHELVTQGQQSCIVLRLMAEAVCSWILYPTLPKATTAERISQSAFLSRKPRDVCFIPKTVGTSSRESEGNLPESVVSISWPTHYPGEVSFFVCVEDGAWGRHGKAPQESSLLTKHGNFHDADLCIGLILVHVCAAKVSTWINIFKHRSGFLGSCSGFVTVILYVLGSHFLVWASVSNSTKSRDKTG